MRPDCGSYFRRADVPHSGSGCDDTAADPATPARRVKRLILLIGLLVLVAYNPLAVSGAESRQLAQAGEWELLLSEDPFATPPRRCSVRSMSEGGAGARRTRPRINAALSNAEISIDPTIRLTQAMSIYRKIIDDRDAADAERFMPENVLRHRLRVDGGDVIEVKIKDPKFEPWAIHRTIDGTARLVAAMSAGKKLYYQWNMGQASESFEFDLGAFAELVRKAASLCR
jgi:hypothetical protein